MHKQAQKFKRIEAEEAKIREEAALETGNVAKAIPLTDLQEMTLDLFGNFHRIHSCLQNIEVLLKKILEKGNGHLNKFISYNLDDLIEKAEEFIDLINGGK